MPYTLQTTAPEATREILEEKDALSMDPLRVESARYRPGAENTKWLIVDVDGRAVGIWEEQKLLRHGAVVFLRPPGLSIDYDHHERYTWLWEADPDDGRPRDELVTAATADPRILRLTRSYHRDVATGRWRPGRL